MEPNCVVIVVNTKQLSGKFFFFLQKIQSLQIFYNFPI